MQFKEARHMTFDEYVEYVLEQSGPEARELYRENPRLWEIRKNDIRTTWRFIQETKHESG